MTTELEKFKEFVSKSILNNAPDDSATNGDVDETFNYLEIYTKCLSNSVSECESEANKILEAFTGNDSEAEILAASLEDEILKIQDYFQEKYMS